MIITNSLGSNYTAEDRKLVIKLLFQPWKWREGHALTSLREAIATKQSAVTRLPRAAKGGSRNDNLQSFRGPLRGAGIYLFLKGRQAIEEALRQLNIGPGDEVIVQAFTCVAVVEPILNLGAMPIYADVNGRSLNPSLKNIKKVVSDKTKVVILQHTLGYVNPENEEICEWAQKNKIAVIQDLTHAVGATVLRSDLSILSFSQDKVFDGISGGALISSAVIPAPACNSYAVSIAGRKAGINKNNLNRFRISTTQGRDSGMTGRDILKLLLYPLITYAIRATYDLGIGKVVHFLSQNMGLMNSPIYTPNEVSLPNAFASLALRQFNELDGNIEHRKEIALQYNKLIKNIYKIVNQDSVENGSNLRYPLWVNNRDELENKLQKHNFYLVDHWYDAPVSPKWIEPEKVQYQVKSCPNAEELAKHIFNLPTHINISLKKAKELAGLINKYGE